MKNRRVLLSLVILATAGLLTRSVLVRMDDDQETYDGPLGDDPETGTLLVDLDDDASASDIARLNAELVRALAPLDQIPHEPLAIIEDDARLGRMTVRESEMADIYRALRADPDVDSFEIEHFYSMPENELATVAEVAVPAGDAEATRGPFRPNDPFYKHQWHLDQIQMPDAWPITRGEGAVVAVIDTGVLYRDARADTLSFRRPPDLAETRFVPGWDFVDGDDSPDDEHGHGTHVAGTIAQSTNNGVGVAGVAPGAAIMPIRVLDRNGAGATGNVAAGIRWAADHGANVINLSLGGGMPSLVVRSALEHARAKGVVVVAAAGNASRGRVEYPAAHANVISVSAVRFDETLSFYSSYGPGLTIAAPGGDLRVDQNGDGMPDGVLQNTMLRGNPSRHDYLAFQGTSMATPHVAGAAALLYAAGVRDPDRVRALLTESAKTKSDRARYGAGVLQVASALRLARHGAEGGRGVVALLLAGVALFGLRRRRELSVPYAPIVGLAFVLAGGLAILPFELVPGVGSTLGALSEGPLASIAEVSPWLALLMTSALPALGLTALLLSVRGMTPLLAGLSFASAGVMVAEAVLPTLRMALLPDLLVGPWLLANAGFCMALGVLVASRRRSGVTA